MLAHNGVKNHGELSRNRYMHMQGCFRKYFMQCDTILKNTYLMSKSKNVVN